MSLSKELLQVLDNNDEPLTKRIKIADNAFKSSDFPLKNREAFLLKWSLKSADSSFVDLINNWLKSEHFKELDRNDVTNSDIETIIDLIIKNLDKDDIKAASLESASLLLENSLFHQFFKYNLNTYCILLTNIINRIDCPKKLIEFLRNDFTFYRHIIQEVGFYRDFIDVCVPVLVEVIIKFKDDSIFKEISKIVQRCIFSKHVKDFEGYFNRFFNQEKTADKHSLAKDVFKYIIKCYNFKLENAKVTYKLLFHGFCAVYDDFGLKYKLFVLLTEILGFDLKEKFDLKKVAKLSSTETYLSKSTEIFNELINVLSESKVDLDYKLNDVSCSDFIKELLLNLICVCPTSRTLYNICQKIFVINPLIAESAIKQLIINTLLADNKDCMPEYIKFLTAIFEVFSKLHRIQNLIAKLIPSVKTGLEEINDFEESIPFKGTRDVSRRKPDNYNIDQVLPKPILEYFRFCLTNLASWQVMNLFKTFIFHLDAGVQELQSTNKTDASFVIYMEIISTLTCSMLSSVRIAEHTVSPNVVEKFVKSLDELKTILKHFGKALLNIEHNQLLVRVLLNVAYSWAEIYMVLSYYSDNKDVNFERHADANLSACNLTYLHSYLTAKQWCLLSERINNFGEKPCKELMLKLVIQKLRAHIILEQSYNTDIALNIAKHLSLSVNDNWRSVMLDSFVVKHLLVKVEPEHVFILAENIIDHLSEITNQNLENILDSQLLLNVLNYVILAKVNKLMKQKKKRDIKPLSCQVFSAFNPEAFFDKDISNLVTTAKTVYNTNIKNCDEKVIYKLNEEKTLSTLELLKKFPIVSSSQNIQKLYIMYMFAIHKDICNNYPKLQESIETIIIGLLHHIKFNLLEIFEPNELCLQIINNFSHYENIFQQVTDSSMKNISLYEGCITCLEQHMKKPNFVKCAIIFLNSHYKMKKSKLPAEAKNLSNEYKVRICNKMLKVILKKGPEDYLMGPFAHILKHFLNTKDSQEELNSLKGRLTEFINFALEHCDSKDIQGTLNLFAVILNNKNQIDTLEQDLTLKIWNWSKQLCISTEHADEHAQLIILIFSLIPNEQFEDLTKDLLDSTFDKVKKKDWRNVTNSIQTWESIVTCNFNPAKLKLWQTALQELLQVLLEIVDKDATISTSTIKLVETIITNTQLFITPQLVDMFLLVPMSLLENCDNIHDGLFDRFEQSILILEALLKHRKALIMDRLPVFQQQYCKLLNTLCQMSDSEKEKTTTTLHRLSDCAHHFEKLTRNIVACQKDMSRISMYLVADILEKYERITLYPSIKIHLNNCIYSLISLCDQHAISYLMRVLSSASTEMFKILYDNYKKYYRFTGKV